MDKTLIIVKESQLPWTVLSLLPRFFADSELVSTSDVNYAVEETGIN